MRARFVNEQQSFERGKEPKISMGVGGFDFKEIKDQTWGKGIKDWKDFLNKFNGKKISFVAQPNFDTPYVRPDKRIVKKVKDWGFNEGMYNHVWFFDANSHPHKQYYIDLDHKVYIVDGVNENLSPEEKREEVMKILNNRNIQVPHDSYVKFFDLSLTDLSPDEIVDRLISESANFERDQDPKKSMGLGINNFYDYVNIQAKKAGLDPEDFWEERYNYARDEDGADILDELYNVLLKTPIDYQIGYIGGLVEDWIEDNSELSESENFERGTDPKKSLGLGLDCEKYVKLRLSKTPYNTEYDEERFWDLFYSAFEDASIEEIGEHIIYILNKSFNNPKYMIEYMDSEIENYIQFRQETDDGDES